MNDKVFTDPLQERFDPNLTCPNDGHSR